MQINDLRGDAAGIIASSLQGAGIDVGSGDGLVRVSAGIGLWLALAGGVVAIVAGGLALGRRDRAAAAGPGISATTSAFVGADDPGPASEPWALTPEPPPTPVGSIPEAPPPPPLDGGTAGSA
jgi:hypothetical protein